MLYRNSLLGLVALSALVACSGNNNFDSEGGTDPNSEGGTNPGDEGGTMDDDSGIPLPKNPALAAGVSITQIAGYQTVKVPMMNNGSPATGKAPLVAGKEANIRVFFKLDPGWTPHNIVAVMTITAGGMTTTVKDVLGPLMDSSEDVAVSTFNLHLDGTQTTVDATYDIKIVDPAKTANPTSDPAPQRYPTDGTQTALKAVSTGQNLNIVLIPMKYNPDGSGRMPDTSQAQLDIYKNLFYSMYPIPNVNVTVHSPVNVNSAITAGGSGWNSALNTIANLRQTDGASPDKYYYGIFVPAASFAQFCGGGCIAGLSLLSQQPSDAFSRVGVGLGYGGQQDGYESAFTAAHEVGHQHGRNHAPCQVNNGVDPYYPYAGGLTNTYGWSLKDTGYFAANSLIGMKVQNYNVSDIMGYCQLKWISDYNYKALMDRIKIVNGAKIAPGPTVNYKWSMVDENNAVLSGGSTFQGNLPPGGEPKTLNGKSGWFYPYDHIKGGMFLTQD